MAERVRDLEIELKSWLNALSMLGEGHEPYDLHHYLLHYLLIYQAGRFLSFSSLRQVAKPAPSASICCL
ncbi:hypothetical protein DS906_10965 [Ruegeria sp. A3M17]|nr:hypothetical protein DS906_10965 [Ruegeria sp. A3M17]